MRKIMKKRRKNALDLKKVQSKKIGLKKVQ